MFFIEPGRIFFLKGVTFSNPKFVQMRQGLDAGSEEDVTWNVLPMYLLGSGEKEKLVFRSFVSELTGGSLVSRRWKCFAFSLESQSRL